MLCALYIAPKAVAPFVQRLQGLAGDSDSLRTRIFPSLAFIALCAITLKLSVF